MRSEVRIMPRAYQESVKTERSMTGVTARDT